jgi:hypothetical protein
MAKIATGGFSHTSIDVTQCLVNKQHTKFREVQKWGIAFAGDTMLKAAIERHPAMLRHKKMNRFFPHQHVTAKNQQTCWRCHSAGAFLPNWHRLPSPDPLWFLRGSHLHPQLNYSEMNNLQHGCMDLRIPLPSGPCFNLDAYVQDCQYDTVYNPVMLTDKGTSTS